MTAVSDLIVVPDTPMTAASSGWAVLGQRRWRCALGAGGVHADKHEGDGATPTGRFALRRLLFRPDRLPRPVCYNRAVALPYPASCEQLWRDDAVYDLILVVGHNDAPPVAGAGSAIFIHCARPDYAPTAGCIAFASGALIELLSLLTPASVLEIRA